jgi:sec-independent protein translocase protein TatB
MLDIGWSELLLIAVVAVVVVGPKDLPVALRALGRTVSKMRKMAGEFQGQFNDALKEAELDDVKKSFDELRSLNPINDIKDSLNPLSGPVAKPAPEPVPPAADQPPQPMTAADIEPSADKPVVAAAPEAAAPVAAAPVATPVSVAAATDGEAPAKVAKPRAKRVKADGESSEPAVSKASKARKTAKSVDSGHQKAAEPASAPEGTPAAVTEEPTT